MSRTPVRLAALAAAAALAFAGPGAVAADRFVFPADFHVQEIASNGATIHVRVGGKGPRFDEEARVHYAQLYAGPGRMHAGFRQFAAFDQDAIDNRAWLAAHGKLQMPVLAIGGEKSFGAMMAVVTRAGADHVAETVIPDAGHWLLEEQPAASVKAIRAFLDEKR